MAWFQVRTSEVTIHTCLYLVEADDQEQAEEKFTDGEWKAELWDEVDNTEEVHITKVDRISEEEANASLPGALIVTKGGA